MSNLFEQVLNDAQGVQDKLLGPTYPYYKNIKTPSQIGMSDKGTLQALGADINGLVQYVQVLVTGNSEASTTGGPLGNKFFLQTGAKCVDTASKKQVDRYIYVDNVPAGNIPFISSGLGVNFSEFKGLIPGTMSDLKVLNPFGIMQAFMSGSTPPCQNLTMQTIDIRNNSSSESHYVTLTDIKNMDACSFPNRQNPLTGKSCQETFQGIAQNAESVPLPDDPLAQIYFASLAAIGIYILYRFMDKASSR